MYCLCVSVYCTVLLPPGVNPIAVNKYINIRYVLLGMEIYCNCTWSVCMMYYYKPTVTNTLMVQNLKDEQGDRKKWELLKNPTKIEEVQKKKVLTEIEPLQLAF